MGATTFLAKLKPSVQQKESSQSSTPARSDSTAEKDNGIIDDSPVKYLTWRSFMLGIVVSMGGFIFGYSTGTFQLRTKYLRLASDNDRSNLRFHHHGRLQETVW